MSRKAPQGQRSLQITLVGDVAVGKVCLQYAYVNKEFIENYFPAIKDDFIRNVTVNEEEVKIVLRDISRYEDYDRLRPLFYGGANCFLLCYSVASRPSYDNVILKWYPELKHYESTVPIILVATKIDLRTSGKAVITTQEGEELKEKIGAVQFVECSALELVNMDQVFEEAIRAANLHTLQSRNNVRTCLCL